MTEATRLGYVHMHAGVALVTWLVWLCSLTVSGRDTYFLLGKGETKMCYVVDHASGTKLDISYWNPDAANSIIILEPMDGHSGVIGPIIRSFNVHDTSGKFEIELQKEGQHTICADASNPEEKLFRFSLDIMLSDEKDNEKYNPFEEANENAKDEEKLVISLLNRLKHLNKRMIFMYIGAKYMESKENKLHIASEDVNYRAMWWPIIQVVAVVFISYVYARHMKGFFKTRNFV